MPGAAWVALPRLVPTRQGGCVQPLKPFQPLNLGTEHNEALNSKAVAGES